MKVKIRKGDTVEVISGRAEDKGKRGEVIKVLPDDGRVVVQGVNLRTKHQRQVQITGPHDQPWPVCALKPRCTSHNVMLVCPKCSKATRVGVTRDGEKVAPGLQELPGHD